MKKIFTLSLVVLLAVSLLVSCSDETPKTDPKAPTENTPVTEEPATPGYDSRFDNYFLAFPEEFRKGHQELLGYTDEEMDAAIAYDTEKVHTNRDEKYGGAEFHIEYTLQEKSEIPAERKANIISDLEDYCYITPGTIEDIVEYKYFVVTYGIDKSTGDRVLEEEQSVTLALLYIKEDGWYVSPTNI